MQKEHLLREKNIQHCVSEVLTFLKDNGLVRFSQCIKDDNAADSSQSIDRALEVTLLGRATFKGKFHN